MEITVTQHGENVFLFFAQKYEDKNHLVIFRKIFPDGEVTEERRSEMERAIDKKIQESQV